MSTVFFLKSISEDQGDQVNTLHEKLDMILILLTKKIYIVLSILLKKMKNDKVTAKTKERFAHPAASYAGEQGEIQTQIKI